MAVGINLDNFASQSPESHLQLQFSARICQCLVLEELVEGRNDRFFGALFSGMKIWSAQGWLERLQKSGHFFVSKSSCLIFTGHGLNVEFEFPNFVKKYSLKRLVK